MNLPNYERFVAVARVVIEAVTPLSVTRGEAERGFDTALLVDANGLPAIPGTALAGVLRHLYAEEFEPPRAKGETRATPRTDTLFGYVGGATQQASRVEVSWAAIHDAHGRPIDELLNDAALEQRLPMGNEYGRQLRALALEPATREHVRLDQRGVASQDGSAGMKFDRAVLPAGHRLTFELILRSNERADADWPRLLQLLAHPAFRLGGATRRGLGRVAVVSIHEKVFDLADSAQRAAYLTIPRSLGERGALQPRPPEPRATAWRDWERIEIRWRPTQEWRIGGRGDKSSSGDHEADMRPLREPIVRWKTDSTPTVEEQWVLPASGLKGALAHRIVYHTNRLERRWAGIADPARVPYAADRCPTVEPLFGFVRSAKGTNEKSEPVARAGAVLFDDRLVADGCLAMNGRVGRMQHVSGDRFTGGALNGALFDEEYLPPGGERGDAWRFDCWVRKSVDANARRALVSALEDWLGGRLNIGAAGSRGFGFGAGRMTLPDGWSASRGST